MSMRELADPGEGAWLEAEIDRELAQLSPVDTDLSLEESGDDLEQEEEVQNDNDYNDDVPESLAVYLEHVQSRAGLVEEGLMECEDVMQHTVTHAAPGALVTFTSSDLLDQLAASTGQNPAELKRRVLQEIEAEEKEEEEEELGLLDGKTDSMEQLDGGGGQEGATGGTGSPGDNGETGAVMLYGVDDLERQLTLQLRQFQLQQQVHERQLQEQLQHRRQEEEHWHLEQVERSKRRDAEFHKQQKELEKQQQEEQAKLDVELQEEDRRKVELLRQHEQQIQQLSQQTEAEKAAFYIQQEKEKGRLETQKQKAAAKIQAGFRSYKVRKIHGPVLKEKRENRKKSWALNRQLELEKHKKEMELKQKLEEKERKRIEDEARNAEERKKKEEEQRRIKELEEKARIQKEEQKKEEERRREEQRRKQEEAEKRKREEERKKEEKKKREEEERKRQEEQKKQEMIKKREEEERQRQEEDEERRAKERQLRCVEEEEERRKHKEKKNKLEEQERRRREEEQKKIDEEAKKTKEAEERRSNVKNTGNVEIVKPDQLHNTSDTHQGKIDSLTIQDNPTIERKPCTPDDMMTMANDVDRRRLRWMELCRPWSQVSLQLKHRKIRKGGRGAARPASAKNLPELTDGQLLMASKPGTALAKVEEVHIEGVTGCSLSRLAECPDLVSVSVKQCEAQVLEGVQNCARLQHIDASQNRLSLLVCTGCTTLDSLLASHNQLSSIHGLDGCNNLQVLDLSHNKITRIGGLDSCVHLQHLDLSYNQLISLRGLQLAPTLLQLDVSHNHLPAADNLQDSALLQHLNLASNTLTQPPTLNNHVLLRSLVLDDNSISNLDVLSTAWLPLLSLLSVKQNSLTQVTSLCHLLLLEHLDVSHNQLEDVSGVAGGVSACVRLATLNVVGNPLTEDNSYRSDLVSVLPSLCHLDGEEVRQRSSVASDTELPFVRMCLAQREQWDSMKCRHEVELKAAKQSGNVKGWLSVQHGYHEDCCQLAVDHRYAHEYGDMDITGPAVSEKDTGVDSTDQTSRLALKVMSANEEKESKNDIATNERQTECPSQSEQSVVTTDKRTHSSAPDGRTKANSAQAPTQGMSGKPAASFGGRSTSAGINSCQQGYAVASKYQGEETSLASIAATRIQAAWRGYSVRRDMRQYTQDWLAANTIQEAATKIQAAWRGHSLRLRLKRALQAARWDHVQEEDDDDDFGEVDLSSFDLQAAELDQAWAPPQTPTLPARHPVLGSVSSELQEGTQPLWNTRQAWQGVTPSPPPPSPKHPLPPVKPPSRASSASSLHHPTPPTSRLGSVISTKSEQLTEEWGFKSGTTAELMMKRARRMKARKKKTLDPQQRLALQRKLAEKEAPPTVRAPPRRQTNRVDYFKARDAMHQFLDSAEAEPEYVQDERRQKMTYTWVHTQVGQVDTSPEKPELNRLMRSTGTLPRLDPDIIATGRVQLVRTPPHAQLEGLELESVDGTSTSDQQSHRERRHSIDGDSPRERLSEPCPPKTNSAPSEKLRERLSRHREVDKSAGWGSGRRRIQLFKM